MAVSEHFSAGAAPRVDVLGVGISIIDYDAAVEHVAAWIEQREQHHVCVTGVHGVMEAQHDPALRRILNGSGLTTPDGMPMVWSGKWAGADNMTRVRGPSLMQHLCARAAKEGWTSFFYGGNEGVAELLAERLAERFPGFKVVGTHTPPFRPLTPAEDEAVVGQINQAAPDLLWVGLSTPKQEYWMASHLGRVRAPVLLGVGAAFDVNAGLQPEAPAYLQRAGLEWAYRLAREPRRLWRRYASNNPRFAAAIVRQPPRLVREVG
jgi:N-acetylglucosaminyldiphosphoundecaprenol N-acetyl-beta-D-mannosaminyltransferase